MSLIAVPENPRAARKVRCYDEAARRDDVSHVEFGDGSAGSNV